MRQLFVPACLCVMTWSNTAGFDLPPDRLNLSTFDKKVLMREASTDADTQDDSAAAKDDASEALAYEPFSGDDVADQLRPAVDPLRVPLPPVPKPVVNRSRAEICDTLTRAAEHNNLPLSFFIRLLFQESAFQPGVVSSAGAEGIAQFMPETSASEGLHNPFDPAEAIPASARFLRKLIGQFGNLGLAAAAYNAGPKRIQDWLARKGNLPEETQGYVKTVTGRPAETWRVASADGTAQTVPNEAPCAEFVPPPTPAPRPVVAAHKPAPHQGKIRLAAHIAATKIAKLAKIAKTGKPAKAPEHKQPARELAKEPKQPTRELAARKQKNKKFAAR